MSAFTELLSRTLPSDGYFCMIAVVLKVNYRLCKSGNGKCKAYYTRFKFGNGGFYPSDVLCNGADSGFNAGCVGFTVIYRILEFGNSECKGAAGGSEASGGGFGTNYRTVMVDNMRCGACCKRMEFGIDGRKESSEDADMSVELPRPDPVPEKTRPYFAKLRDDLEKLGGAPLPQLSMGMSHDFETAIEEGSSIVRVGSAIFGSRA